MKTFYIRVNEENQIMSVFNSRQHNDLIEVETEIDLLKFENLMHYSYLDNKIVKTFIEEAEEIIEE